MNINPDQPFFYVEENKVVFMSDTTVHLIKTLRMNFVKYKFVLDQKTNVMGKQQLFMNTIRST